MSVHRIQLKGPWEYRWLENLAKLDHPPSIPGKTKTIAEFRGDVAPAGVVKFPLIWSEFLGDSYGTIEVRRPFNCPTNLTPDDRVDLVLEQFQGVHEVQMNGVPLGKLPETADQARFDITSRLFLHNEIRIRLTRSDLTPGPCGLWGSVCLEIHDLT